jgi:hypothetical protein
VVDTVRTQAELLAFLHPNIPNPQPDATVLVSQAARDLIVSIFPYLPGPPDPNGVNQAPGGGTGSRMQIIEGGPAHPALSNRASTVLVSRYSAMTAATDANAAALIAVNVDSGSLTQAVGVHAEATQVNTGDAAGTLSYATISATASVSGGQHPTAYGVFGDGISLLATGRAVGGNFLVQTVSDKTFLGDAGTEITSGVFIQCNPISLVTHYLMGTAILVESVNSALAQFEVGLGFFAGSVSRTGIDMTQLTLSDSYLKMQSNFLIGLSGTDPAIEFDAGGDSLIYTRANNLWNLQVANNTVLAVGSNFYQLNGLPAANPGPGFKLLWYNPADANRVYFAP